MKIHDLKKRIIINFSVAGVFAVIFASIFYFYSVEKNSVESKIGKINAETSQLNTELTDLQSKTAEIKKYKDLWSNISANKKSTAAIKLDEIHAKLNSVANKYGVGNQSIKLTLPEVVKGGIFDCKTVNVTMITANLTFSAVNDVKAVMFVNEFLDSLKGYPVVTSFSIAKDKDYTGKDLVDISTGKLAGYVNGKINFFWYIYKELEKKEETKTTTETKAAEAPNAETPAN